MDFGYRVFLGALFNGKKTLKFIVRTMENFKSVNKIVMAYKETGNLVIQQYE